MCLSQEKNDLSLEVNKAALEALVLEELIGKTMGIDQYKLLGQGTSHNIQDNPKNQSKLEQYKCGKNCR